MSKFLFILAFIVFLLSFKVLFTAQGSLLLNREFYSVRVRIQIGNCYQNRDITVEATSSSDARAQALRIARQEPRITVTNWKEIR